MNIFNYSIDNIVAYLQLFTAQEVLIVQARAQAQLTALGQAANPGAFAVQSRRGSRMEGQGSLAQVLKVIDAMELADLADLQRIEAVATVLAGLDAEQSSSSSESSSSSSSSASISSMSVSSKSSP